MLIGFGDCYVRSTYWSRAYNWPFCRCHGGYSFSVSVIESRAHLSKQFSLKLLYSLVSLAISMPVRMDHWLRQGGTDERSVPGNTIAVQADMPFSGLSKFGTAFLSKFECSLMPHPVSTHLQKCVLFQWNITLKETLHASMCSANF
jgi:hypothetical protein